MFAVQFSNKSTHLTQDEKDEFMLGGKSVSTAVLTKNMEDK